jgi:hypothetical protein
MACTSTPLGVAPAARVMPKNSTPAISPGSFGKARTTPSPLRRVNSSGDSSKKALNRGATSSLKGTFDDAAFEMIVREEREIETARRLRRARAMQRSCGMIDPRSTSWTPVWDATMLVAVLAVSIVTPVEVAFLGDAGDVNVLWVLNRCVDVLFFIDIVINFNLAYQEPIARGGYWVFNRGMVVRRYLHGWFLIDVLSVAPWWSLAFDWDGKGESAAQATAEHAESSAGGAPRAAVLVRIVKLLRLLRLARVVKAARASSPVQRYLLDVATGRWEWTYAVLQMIQLIVVLCFYSHWQACAWGLFSSYMEDDGYPNWMGAFNQGHQDTFGVPAGPIDRYVAALYWSMMTVTGIGYGEMLPVNTTERALCTLWQFLSGVIWTYAIGTVAMIATTLDPNGVAFRNTMDSLNFFMRERELPRHMRMMLREYFTLARNVHQVRTRCLPAGCCPHLFRYALSVPCGVLFAGVHTL